MSDLFGRTPGEVRTTSTTGGAKGTKVARFDQVPPLALLELAEHYGKGNSKYPSEPMTPDNWRLGYEWSKSYAALQRHATQFWSGEDIDAETGSKHLIAVAWHALAMATWMDDPTLREQYDDRPEALVRKARDQ